MGAVATLEERTHSASTFMGLQYLHKGFWFPALISLISNVHGSGAVLSKLGILSIVSEGASALAVALSGCSIAAFIYA